MNSNLSSCQLQLGMGREGGRQSSLSVPGAPSMEILVNYENKKCLSENYCSYFHLRQVMFISEEDVQIYNYSRSRWICAVPDRGDVNSLWPYLKNLSVNDYLTATHWAVENETYRHLLNLNVLHGLLVLLSDSIELLFSVIAFTQYKM